MSERSRKLTVIWERDSTKNHVVDDITYTGSRITWEDGSPVSVGIEKLCQAGMKTVIGKDATGDRYALMIESTIVAEGSPRDKRADGIRRRRLYIQREDQNIRLFFHNGVPTDIIFSNNDDPRALDFFAVTELVADEKIWFDVTIQTIETQNGQPTGQPVG